MSTLYKCLIKWGNAVERSVPVIYYIARVGCRTLIGDNLTGVNVPRGY